MRLTVTSKLWGNGYRNTYFLKGKKIAKGYADYLFKNHVWEDDGFERPDGVTHRSHYDIGPSIAEIEAMQDAYQSEYY